MNLILTQIEAETFLSCSKYYYGSKKYEFPNIGDVLKIPLHSEDKQTEFILDISRGFFRFNKFTYQNRVFKNIILLRLDINGPPHRNPDGKIIDSSHLHIYREGYDDKWAYSLPDKFKNCKTSFQLLEEFMDYCHIVNKPMIENSTLSEILL